METMKGDKQEFNEFFTLSFICTYTTSSPLLDLRCGSFHRLFRVAKLLSSRIH